MGYRARWVAVKDAALAPVLKAIGLREESQSDEEIYDPGIYAVTMPGGWLVVMGDGWDFMHIVEESHAKVLSKGAEAIHFYCDDTSMTATMTAFANGTKTWGLEYEPRHLKISGKPPAIVEEVVARVCEEQEKEDAKTNEKYPVDHVYDAAPQIGLALTGFRHDQTLGSGDVLPILILAEK